MFCIQMHAAYAFSENKEKFIIQIIQERCLIQYNLWYANKTATKSSINETINEFNKTWQTVILHVKLF